MKAGAAKWVTFSDRLGNTGPEGLLTVSVKAVDAIIKKYKVRPDRWGNYQIERWMITEMLGWDEHNGTGPR